MQRGYRIATVISALFGLAVLPYAWGILGSAHIFASAEPLQIFLRLLNFVWIFAPWMALFGALRARRWAYWMLYLSAITGVLFGSTVLPWVHQLVSREVGSLLYLYLNLAALLGIVFLHLRSYGIEGERRVA